MNRRGWAVLALAVAAGCAAASLVVGGDSVATAEPVATAPSPVWSPRRVPQPFVDAVGATRLQQQLDAALAGSDGCVAVDDAAGVVARHNVEQGYIGASTQKILTAAAALATLGPDHVFTTEVRASGNPENGAVDKLFLIGGGDPWLSTADFRSQLGADPKYAGVAFTSLEALADAVAAKGVTRVGGLVVDDGRYDATRYLPSWSSSYRTEGQVGPLGALTVNRGFTSQPPRPAPVDDPAVHAGDRLAALLKARGITVGGTPGRAKVPDGTVEVAKVSSVPVKDLAAGMLRASDNLAAELLVREMGVAAAKSGTTEAGAKAALAKLAELGVPTDGLVMVDGSGLSRDDRVTCRALTATLDLGARPDLAALWSGLPIAAQTGTLADEFQGTSLAGRLRGKTGFLNGVTGLAGVLDVGRPLRFAFVVDGSFGETQAIRLRSQLAQIIARYPEAPPADALVPAPPAAPAAAAPGS